MNHKQLERANEINKSLINIDKALKQIDGACNYAVDEPSWVHLSQYDDGSGWSIELFQTVPAREVLHVLEQLLIKEKKKLTSEFEAI